MTPEQKAETTELMKMLADGIGRVINPKDKTFAFVLLIAPFDSAAADPDTKKRCNYISNADRRDMVVMLKEMVARFEGQPQQAGRA